MPLPGSDLEKLASAIAERPQLLAIAATMATSVAAYPLATVYPGACGRFSNARRASRIRQKSLPDFHWGRGRERHRFSDQSEIMTATSFVQGSANKSADSDN